MAGIALPSWYTLKGNVKTILSAIATEEKAVAPERNFIVARDRWRPWIEKQQKVALVNVLVPSVDPDTGHSGSRRYRQDLVTVNLDMYVLGTHEEQDGDLTPADEVAAARLDLLVAQLRAGITRMENDSLGFTRGTIGEIQGLALQTYSQENEEATGQYAPARWSFQVAMPFFPTEAPDGPALTEVNLTFKQLLEDWSMRFEYPPAAEEEPT